MSNSRFPCSFHDVPADLGLELVSGWQCGERSVTLRICLKDQNLAFEAIIALRYFGLTRLAGFQT